MFNNDGASLAVRIRREVSSIGFAFLILIAILAAWSLLARDLPVFVLPGPMAVAEKLAAFLFDENLLAHLAATAARVVIATVFATLVGVGLALLPYYHPVMRGIVEGRIQPFLSAMPSIGWIIIGAIWFGMSNSLVIFVQVVIILPFCLVNVSQGIRELDTEIVEMARSMTRSKWRIFKGVILPLLMPYIAASVRMAYGVCWKIALVAELFGTDRGLGYIMLQAQSVSDATTVLSTCLVIVVVYWASDRIILQPLLNRFVTRAERA